MAEGNPDYAHSRGRCDTGWPPGRDAGFVTPHTVPRPRRAQDRRSCRPWAVDHPGGRPTVTGVSAIRVTFNLTIACYIVGRQT